MSKLFTAALAASLIVGTAVAASADALQQLDGDTATAATTAMTVADDACDEEQSFTGQVRLRWNGAEHYDSGTDVTLVTEVTPSDAGVTSSGSSTSLGTWNSTAADKLLAFTITVGTSALDGDYDVAVSTTGDGYKVTGSPTSPTITDSPAYEVSAGSITVTIDCGRTTPAENSPPTITDLDLDADPTDVCTVDASVAWTDDDADDSHSVSFDWGDSSSTVVDSATSATSRSHSYATAGTYTVGVTVSDGTDADDAFGSFTAYNTPSGILQPINANGTSSFKINSTVPVKITVIGCDSQPVTTIAPTISLSYDGGVAPLVNETVVSTSAADTGNVMRWSPEGLQYIYNLATKNRAAGQYTMTIDHESFETPVTANFSLRK